MRNCRHRYTPWKFTAYTLERLPCIGSTVWFEVDASSFCLRCGVSRGYGGGCTLTECESCPGRHVLARSDGRRVICCDQYDYVLCEDWPSAGRNFAVYVTPDQLAAVLTDPDAIENCLNSALNRR